MQYFDDLYIVRTPPISPAQWEAFIAGRDDFSRPDRFADCRVYLGDVELTGAGVYVWLGHSSSQQVPVYVTAGHIYFAGIDNETVSFVQRLAFLLDACVIHKVHPMNVAALPGQPAPLADTDIAV